MAGEEGWVYFAISTALVLLRLYARLHSPAQSGFHLDDHLISLTIPLFLAVVILAQVIETETRNLANNNMTPEERTQLDPGSDEFHLRVRGSQLHMAGWVLYVTMLWALKFCWLVMYRRFGERVGSIRLKINAGIALCATTYLIVIFVIIFACRPIDRNWQINPDPGDACHPAVSKVQSVIAAVANLSTDIYIISIPLPIIWGARISKLDKGILATMFVACLVITMAVGTARCGIILANKSEDTAFVGQWSSRETFVAIVISNIPVLFPWIRQRLQRGRDDVKDPIKLQPPPPPPPLQSLAMDSEETIVQPVEDDEHLVDVEAADPKKRDAETAEVICTIRSATSSGSSKGMMASGTGKSIIENMGVRTAAGKTALILTDGFPSRCFSSVCRPWTAQATTPAAGERAATDEATMTWPLSAATMAGMNARTQKRTPSRLTSRVDRKSASAMSRRVSPPPLRTPALATRAVGAWPKRAAMASRAASTEARSDTSAWMNMDLSPDRERWGGEGEKRERQKRTEREVGRPRIQDDDRSAQILKLTNKLVAYAASAARDDNKLAVPTASTRDGRRRVQSQPAQHHGREPEPEEGGKGGEGAADAGWEQHEEKDGCWWEEGQRDEAR
ncbi:hypothetical protein L249_5593, partial [Ophiocordyceps polyrhachis-furcata BCC 54312]